MLSKRLIRLSSTKVSKDYLKFDGRGRAVLFKSNWTRGQIYLALGSVVSVTLSNLYFLHLESQQQYFGVSSMISSVVMGVAGMAFIVYYVTLMPRVIREIRMLRTMREVELVMFPRFMSRPPITLDIADLSSLRPSSLSFHVVDSHRHGKLWLMLNSNEMKVYPGMEDLLKHTLNGNYPPESELEKKVNKFRMRK